MAGRRIVMFAVALGVAILAIVVMVAFEGTPRPNIPTRAKDLSVAKKEDSKTPPKEKVMRKRPDGDCSISGKVISAETGKPIGGAQIYLFYFRTFGCIFVRTESDGTFQIKDIAEGPFSLQTTHVPGCQDVHYNPDNMPGPLSRFTLKKGEQRTGIVFKVKPAYGIAGKILNEEGETPSDIREVMVLALAKDDKSKQYHPQSMSIVDRNSGTYKIDGLDGSPLYVMAIDRRFYSPKESVYLPTYHPGTLSRKEAKQVTFDNQRHVVNVDLVLQTNGGLTLEGTVVDETGQPIPEVVVVARLPDMHAGQVAAYTDKDGKYRIHGLDKKEYQVGFEALHRGFVGACATIDMKKSNGQKPLTLDTSLKQGATITGKFVDEKGKAWKIAESHGHASIQDPKKPSSYIHYSGPWNKYRPKGVAENPSTFITVFLEKGETRGEFSGGQMTFPTKSTFTFQGLKPGVTTISFSPKKENQKTVKILYQGKDVLKSGIETKPGQEIKDVTIVIGPGNEKTVK